MVILVDTREQSNYHITGYFDKRGIAYKSKALNYGDYSAYIPADPELGIVRPLYFDQSIVIERKGSLEELSGNLTKGRERLKDELTRASSSQFHLMIEGGSYAEIINGEYLTDFKPKSYLASLLSLQCEYGFNIHFTDKQNAGLLLYQLIYYHVRKTLMKG
jgi:ERCC4-type nuclease